LKKGDVKMVEKISATSKKIEEALGEGTSVQVNYTFGDTLAEEVERIGGEEKALAFLKSATTIKLQSLIRGRAEKMLAEGDIDVEALQKVADEYIPGNVSRSKKSNVDKGLDIAGKMTAEELVEYAAMLAEKAAELQADNAQ
jgi:hypothetical protein